MPTQLASTPTVDQLLQFCGLAEYRKQLETAGYNDVSDLKRKSAEIATVIKPYVPRRKLLRALEQWTCGDASEQKSDDTDEEPDGPPELLDECEELGY